MGGEAFVHRPTFPRSSNTVANVTRLNEYDVPEEAARISLRDWMREHENQLHAQGKRDAELSAQIDELRSRINAIERSIGE